MSIASEFRNLISCGLNAAEFLQLHDRVHITNKDKSVTCGQHCGGFNLRVHFVAAHEFREIQPFQTAEIRAFYSLSRDSRTDH